METERNKRFYVTHVRKAYLEKLQERNIDIEDSVRVEEQWDKVEKY